MCSAVVEKMLAFPHDKLEFVYNRFVSAISFKLEQVRLFIIDITMHQALLLNMSICMFVSTSFNICRDNIDQCPFACLCSPLMVYDLTLYF